jgi:bifunctional polynucleotide phosphatase/kinase
MNLKWNNNGLILEGKTPGFRLSPKIASFDLDGTLITTKSGRKFPKDEKDWVFNYKCVPKKIGQLIKDGFCIIIISNQSGLDGNDKKLNEWKIKLFDIVKELGIDIQILAALTKDSYRKPQTKIIEEFFPDNINKDSFYCGDAAGRDGDFADTDYKFALNASLDFKLPEHLFLNEKHELPTINYPIDFNNKSNPLKLNFTPNKKDNEMIIMVGCPGSGKSSVSKVLNQKYDYVIINQDTLKTAVKCMKEAEKTIKNKQSLIIDCTNPSKEKRKPYIDLAKKHNYNVKVMKMTTSLEHAKHNNFYRSAIQNISHVPDIAYNMYKSKYEEPDLSEGITEIINQDPGYPDNDKYFEYFV